MLVTAVVTEGACQVPNNTSDMLDNIGYKIHTETGYLVERFTLGLLPCSQY